MAMYVDPKSNIVSQPCWRHTRVNWLLTNEQEASPPADDYFVRKYWQFRLDLEKTRSAGKDLSGAAARIAVRNAERKLYLSYPAIYQAYQLFHGIGADEAAPAYARMQPLKHAIEGLILGMASPKTIAASLLQDVEVVRWYERLFYDMRRIAVSSGALYTMGIPGAQAANVSIHDPDTVWKVIAAAHGAEMLCTVIAKGIATPEQMQRLREAAAIERQKKLTFSATHNLDVNSFNYADIANVHAQVNREEREASQLTTGEITQTNELLVEQLKFTSASALELARQKSKPVRALLSGSQPDEKGK